MTKLQNLSQMMVWKPSPANNQIERYLAQDGKIVTANIDYDGRPSLCPWYSGKALRRINRLSRNQKSQQKIESSKRSRITSRNRNRKGNYVIKSNAFLEEVDF